MPSEPASTSPFPPERILTGHPVDVMTGVVYTAWTDFLIRGYVPLRWRRFYSTAHLRPGPLGIGWTTAWFMSLHRDGDSVILVNEENNPIVFPRSCESDGKRVNPGAQMELYIRNGSPVIHHWHDHLRYVFEPMPGQSRFRLSAVESLVGDTAKLTYDVEGRLVAIAELGGRTIVISHDAGGRIARLELTGPGAGPTILVQFDYDQHGHLIRATDPCGGVLGYQYDREGRLTVETNAVGGRFYFTYDALGRCTHSVGDGGYLERLLEYSLDGNSTRVKDSRGAVRTYSSGFGGGITKVVDPLGNIKQKVVAGKRSQEIHPTGASLSIERDEKGDIVKQIDMGGGVTEYAWNSLHLCTSETDAEGHQWIYEYDEAGRTTGAVDGSGARWNFKSNSHGRFEEIVDPLGAITRFAYDHYGNRVLKIDAEGGRTEYAYNLRGSLIARRDRYGNRFRYEYDASQRIQRMECNDRTLARWNYDPAGRVVEYEDATGKRCATEYSLWGQPLRVSPWRKDAAHSDVPEVATRWSYDTEGRVIEYRDPGQRGCRCEYDLLDRLTRKIYTDGGEDEYRYDAVGNVVWRSIDGAEPVTFEYTPARKLLRKNLPGGKNVEFTYNRLGQLVKAQNQVSVLEFERNAFGQITAESQNGKVIRHAYNALGSRTTTVFPDVAPVHYEYDKLRRLKAVRGPVEERLLYDNAGPSWTERLLGNGVLERYSYSTAANSLRQSVSRRASSEPAIAERVYELDGGGLVRRLTEKPRGTVDLVYDDLHRLCAVFLQGKEVEHFTYDDSNNIVSGHASSRLYDARNRIVQDGMVRYEYDRLARKLTIRTESKVVAHHFDAEGQLESVTGAAGDEIRFEYDPIGRRTRKRGPAGTTEYRWDLDNLFSESRGPTQHDYYFFAPASHRPIAKLVRRDKQGPNLEAYYYHTDTIGTPRELSGPDGRLAWQAQYSAYGLCSVKTGAPNLNPLRFPGQYYDHETGLHYNRFRYYDPRLGRFLTADPIGYNGGSNLFAYPFDPFNRIDPLGLNCGDPDRVHIYHGTLDEDSLRETGFHTRDKYGGEGVPPFVCVSTDPAAAKDALNPTRLAVDDAPAPAVLVGSMSKEEWNQLHASGDLKDNNYNGFHDNLGGSSETKARTPAGVAALNRAFGLPGGGSG